MHNIGVGTSHWTDSFGQTVVQNIILFPCFLKVFKAVALFKDVDFLLRINGQKSTQA